MGRGDVSARLGGQVVAVAITLWIAIVGADSVQMGVWATPNVHGPHALITKAANASILVTLEHPHVSRGDSPVSAEALADAVLNRGAMAPQRVVLIALLVGIAPVWRRRPANGPRGPPRARSETLSGRDILARLCIARR